MKHLYELERARGYTSDFQTFQGMRYHLSWRASGAILFSGFLKYRELLDGQGIMSSRSSVWLICNYSIHGLAHRSLTDLRRRYKSDEQRRHSHGDVSLFVFNVLSFVQDNDCRILHMIFLSVLSRKQRRLSTGAPFPSSSPHYLCLINADLNHLLLSSHRLSNYASPGVTRTQRSTVASVDHPYLASFLRRMTPKFRDYSRGVASLPKWQASR